jgi:hypothetical protein
MNILSRHRGFPDPRSPTQIILTTTIRQLALAVIPLARICQRRHAIPSLRQAPHHMFALSSLQLRTSFNESGDTVVPADIIPQSKFFDSTFASTTDIAWVA